MNGKRVVVLGGTSGIGLATAKAAQREGASIVVVSSRQQRVDSALSALGGKAHGEVVDLSDEGQVRAFFGRIDAFDHLVFCAGETLHLQTLEKMEFDQARGFVNLRFWGRFHSREIRQPSHPLGRVDHLDERRCRGCARARAGRWPRASAARWRRSHSLWQWSAHPGERGLSRRGQDGIVERHARVRRCRSSARQRHGPRLARS